MFTFRRLTMLFFIILLSLNLLIFFSRTGENGLSDNINLWICSHSNWFYLILLASYFGISIALAFLPCSNFHHPAICKGYAQDKSLAITFDDGPQPVKTPRILEILKKRSISATFFCIGRNLIGNEKLILQMVNEGHLVGNHSYSHSKWFDLYSSRKIRNELLETDRLLREITGKTPTFFRPPYGVINPMVSRALKGFHWNVVAWSIRSYDTIRNDPNKITDNIIKSLKPGSILLLHDHTAFSIDHLDNLLLKIDQQGYKIVPLDLLIKKQAYV